MCDNELLLPSQSGFHPGDSTVNQLIAITHQIHVAFEEYPSRETRAVFLDISKAFDKVWHDGLLHKLESNGISGLLRNLIRDFLSERQQCVVLNGKNSDWCHISASVPQGSILGPLFFLVKINDLVDNISSDAKLFANDTSLFTVVYNEETSATVLNNDLHLIKQWAFQWKMQFNADVNKQAVEVIFSCKRNKLAHPLIFLNDIIVKQLPKHKHLGLTLDSKLTFDKHIQESIIKARKGIGVIRFMSKYLQRNVLDQLYKLYVHPPLDYCDVIYHRHDPTFKLEFTKKLESVQYSAALAVSGAWKGTDMDRLYEELGWEPLYYRRWQRRLTHFYKLVNLKTPQYLAQYIPEQRHNPYNLRRCNTYPIMSARTEHFSHTYFPYCIREWNQLDSKYKDSTNA